jgi:glucokinase
MIAVAIDIGGTKTALARVETRGGRVLRAERTATPQGEASGEPFCARLVAMLEADWIAGAGAIGISLCEIVGRDGAVTSGHRVKWQGLPVKARFDRLLPTTLEADVRAAALAEAEQGAGRDLDHFLYVNLGTGISACWVEDGRPWAGVHGAALVFASSPTEMRLPGGGIASYVLEDLAGGAGLLARYRERGGAAASAAAVLARAEGGDAAAAEVVAAAAFALGMALGHAVDLLDPPAVVVGGGLAASDRYLAAIEAQMRRHIWSPAVRGVPLRRAALGGDACLVGAALAAAASLGETVR